jgi:hypothetical protein
MQGAQVHVDGLRDLRRSLRQTGPEAGKELRRRLKGVAEVAARKARAAVPARSGKWRSKITAGASQSAAYVTWGKKTVPYAPWVEFGGKVNTGRAVLRRKFVADGRYIHPTLQKQDPEVEKAAAEALSQGFGDAGWN